jgi:hypothetical protein
MEDLIVMLNKILNNIKLYLYKFYNKSLFLFNKQATIQRLYEPLVSSKTQINKELLKDLSSLKAEGKHLNESAQKLIKENSELKSAISLMQELILKK